jgi:hypothetical protein
MPAASDAARTYALRLIPDRSAFESIAGSSCFLYRTLTTIEGPPGGFEVGAFEELRGMVDSWGFGDLPPGLFLIPLVYSLDIHQRKR